MERCIDDCVYKIMTNTVAYVTPEMERCRNCEPFQMCVCDRYKNIKNTHIPTRYGRVAMYLQQKDGKSDLLEP